MPSRSTKIIILLVIDVLFFLIELIVGYAVGSLALVADSFHMLNDVISLIIALYAIKLSNRTASNTLSYGWHRAEILSALINGVFLLALCFSISLEAIERFFNPTEISNPMLVVIVGSFGLASNILGLFLFHEHGHGHGHGHDHGHGHSHGSGETVDHEHDHDGATIRGVGPSKIPSISITNGEREPLLINVAGGSTTPVGSPTITMMSPRHKRSNSIDSISLFGHPVQNRQYIISKAEDIATTAGLSTSPPSSPTHHRHSSISRTVSSHRRSTSSSNNLAQSKIPEAEDGHSHGHDHDHEHEHNEDHDHAHDHSHANGDHSGAIHKHAHHDSYDEESNKRTGHGHGSMNMRALLLHVLGDALGNVGVILSGLIIWQTTWWWKYYSDPMISLFITVIIFSSALPLVKSASFILLQGVPENINLDDVRSQIEEVPGVVSVHEFHVWQLSETKHIASVHIRLSQSTNFMRAVHTIRKILHRHNIHNATIQPEFEDQSTPDSPVGAACLVACSSKTCDNELICCPPNLPVESHPHN